VAARVLFPAPALSRALAAAPGFRCSRREAAPAMVRLASGRLVPLWGRCSPVAAPWRHGRVGGLLPGHVSPVGLQLCLRRGRRPAPSPVRGFCGGEGRYRLGRWDLRGVVMR
jgi:hypothetical protein